MALITNTLDGGAHGVAVTGSSTATSGTQMTTSAGDTTNVPVKWDTQHAVAGTTSLMVSPIPAGSTRPMVLQDPAFSTAPSSDGAGTVFYMFGSEARNGNITVAALNTSTDVSAISVIHQGDNTVLLQSGSTIHVKSTTKLQPFTFYRIDMNMHGNTASGTVSASISLAGESSPVAADLSVTNAAYDLTGKSFKSLQFGAVVGGASVTGPRTWWDAPAINPGSLTFPGEWFTAIAVGQTIADSSVNGSGTITVNGTEYPWDMTAACADGNDATTITQSLNSKTYHRLKPMMLGGDLQYTLKKVTGGTTQTAQLYAAGTPVGSAKTFLAVADGADASVTWTKAELGSVSGRSLAVEITVVA